MTITPFPPIPDRGNPSFSTLASAFFSAFPQFVTEVNALADWLETLGSGAYAATSVTSLTVGTGSKSLTCESGKGFVVGQPVMIASTASPSNYMSGQVTSYDSGTGALVVSVTTTGGSGTIAAWSVSVISIFTGVSPDSLVVLTSGTSWVCPTGVTKVRLRMCGGGGGGGAGNAGSFCGGSGGGSGTVEALFGVTPGSSYTYAVGAGGAAGSYGGAAAGAGGSTTIVANAITYTATGGGGGASYAGGATGGASGSGSGSGAVVMAGGRGGGGGSYVSQAPGNSHLGYGQGGLSSTSDGAAGTAGAVILELYK